MPDTPRDLLIHGGRIVTPRRRGREADILVRDGSDRRRRIGTHGSRWMPPLFDAGGKLVFPGSDRHAGPLPRAGSGRTRRTSRAVRWQRSAAASRPSSRCPTRSRPRPRRRRWRTSSSARAAALLGRPRLLHGCDGGERRTCWPTGSGCPAAPGSRSSSAPRPAPCSWTNKRRSNASSPPDARASPSIRRTSSGCASVTPPSRRAPPTASTPRCATSRRRSVRRKRLLDLAERHDRPLHVLHISTAEELDLLPRARPEGDLVTAEATRRTTSSSTAPTATTPSAAWCR